MSKFQEDFFKLCSDIDNLPVSGYDSCIKKIGIYNILQNMQLSLQSGKVKIIEKNEKPISNSDEKKEVVLNISEEI